MKTKSLSNQTVEADPCLETRLHDDLLFPVHGSYLVAEHDTNQSIYA